MRVDPFLKFWLLSMSSVSLTLASQALAKAPEERHSEMVVLLVDKTALKADLRTLPDVNATTELIHTFPIAIGKELGDKEKEGDNKTPEGIYSISDYVDTSNLDRAQFGEGGALRVSYPNIFDLYQQKTGSGIWLHGAGNDERMAEAQITRGCVAFFNADILRIKNWLRPQQGLVIIANHLSEVNRSEELKAVHESTLAWVKAWNGRDLDAYMKFYDPEFVLAGRGLKAYRDYKKTVFNMYDKMSVNMSNIRVMTHPKYAVSIMNQDFHGQGSHTKSALGKKILYWQRHSDGWKILREHFETHQYFQPLSYSREDVASLNLSASVRPPTPPL